MMLDLYNTSVDWESIRIQASIAIMQSLVIVRQYHNHPASIAPDAVKCANELIKQLQDNETV